MSGGRSRELARGDGRPLQPLDGRRVSAGLKADGNPQPRWRGAKRPRHRQYQLRAGLAAALAPPETEPGCPKNFARAVTGQIRQLHINVRQSYFITLPFTII